MNFSSSRRVVLSHGWRIRVLPPPPPLWHLNIATYRSSSHGRQVANSSRVATPTETAISIGQQHSGTIDPLTQGEAHNSTLTTSTSTTTTSTSSPSSLSILPFSAVIRSLAITTFTSVPALLGPALTSLSILANSKSPILNPDQNILLKTVLRKTIYSQFCAGETPAEVRKTISDLKHLGYAGVILGYGREVVMDGAETSRLESKAVEGQENDTEHCLREIQEWKEGTMQTVELAEEGDFVALKFTGAGRQALQYLVQGLPPSPTLAKAITDICDRARDRKILLLFDAEQDAVQSAIDSWVLDLQRRYNGSFSMQGKSRALIYNTYQAYRQSTPKTLSAHLAISRQESFVLGVKLVRGAYLNSDPRHLFWATKTETDNAYDSIARSLITQKYNNFVKPAAALSSRTTNDDVQKFPQADLVLASHNRASVEKARALRNEQTRQGEPLIQMVYGQLQGMADDISCQLVCQSAGSRPASSSSSSSEGEIPKPYKYLVWGTVGECTKYLLRRGHENRDAASRTMDTKVAMLKELKRRTLTGRMGASGYTGPS